MQTFGIILIVIGVVLMLACRKIEVGIKRFLLALLGLLIILGGFFAACLG